MATEGHNGCSASAALTGTDLDIEGLVKPQWIKDQDIPHLQEIVRRMVKEPELTSAHKLDAFFRRMCGIWKIPPVSRGNVFYVYRSMCHAGELKFETRIADMLKTKHMREQSGVMVVTLVTSPYPETLKNGEWVKQDFTCKFNCYFCPDQPGQPRSYFFEEPGVKRANHNAFDPVAQFWDRANQYTNMGMVVDKIELLILGGTWHSYPADYRERFIRDAFYAANTYLDPNRNTQPRDRLSLAEEQRINETSSSRCIGVTIESRGDQYTGASIRELRRLGVTRVQMGVQHTDDRVLDRVGRRCKSSVTKRALRLLKDNGFKVDLHFMSDLPQPVKQGVDWRKDEFTVDDIDTTVDMREWDKQMYEKICMDPDWQGDQLKLYPCVTVPFTRIEREYRDGVYKPYGDQQDVKQTTVLHEDLIELKTKLPRWIRVNRVVRDIPSNPYHIGGHKDSGAHSVIKQMMKKRGLECNTIDALEVRGSDVDPATAVFFCDTYQASSGTEHFLNFMTPDRKTLFAFLRLRLSENAGYEMHPTKGSRKSVVFPELVGCALIRELHVYGKVVKVSKTNVSSDGKQLPQHSGFGTRLIQHAMEIARENKFAKMAVIAGVGTIQYYRKFGFEMEELFMTLHI